MHIVPPSVDLRNPQNTDVSWLADHWEITCLRSNRGMASLSDLKQDLQLPGDPNPGEDAEHDIGLEGILDFALDEINDRRNSCGQGRFQYPFDFSNGRQTRITLRKPVRKSDYLYIFLLLATRGNMNRDRVHAGHDATLLFEEICEYSLSAILGSRKQVLRFGASKAGGAFPARIKELCLLLGDEVKPIPSPAYNQTAGDDGLDIAAWVSFSDKRRGKLIIFAQCKTGDSWDTADMSRLRPAEFCRLWMTPQPLITPERAFMVAKRCRRDWWDKSVYGGIFFDRCRVVDFANSIPSTLLSKVKNWVDSAIFRH